MVRSLALAACLVLAPAAARATVLVPIDFRHLVAAAPIIVHGEVVDVRSDWSSGRRAVETFITLHVDEYLKGDLGPEITIRVPGGQLGRYRTIMVGAPVFERGDELVLFLNPGAPQYPSIVGLSQGAFRVVRMPGTSARVVTPPAVATVPRADGERVRRGDEMRRPVSIDQFRRLIRRVLASAGR
jgi:hypothetical protein